MTLKVKDCKKISLSERFNTILEASKTRFSSNNYFMLDPKILPKKIKIIY
jgi:hypothetical protein